MNRQQRRALTKQGGRGSPAADVRSTSPAEVPFRSAVQFLQNGQLTKAELLLRRALQLDPQHANSMNILGTLAFQAGRSEEAASLINLALTLAPENPAFHYNLAAIYQTGGQHEEAVALYQRTIRLRPDHQGAHNNLGLVLHELGRLSEAAEALQRAILLGADARTHSNLGALFLDQGDADRAGAHYRQALLLAPGSVEARTGSATTQLARGDAATALREICEVLAHKDTPNARRVFVACIGAMAPLPIPANAARFLERALVERWGSARDLARFAARVVCERHAGPIDVDALAADSLLVALLDVAPVVDRVLERELTRVRTMLLATARTDGPQNEKLQVVWCALARQCFLNEYVFACTEEEEEGVGALSASLSTFLDAGTVIPPLWLIAVASYRPLVELTDSARLLSRAWTAPVRMLLVQQVEEPLTERRIRAAIPKLTPITDPVSAAVRAQYEDNPYPRWTVAPSPGEAVTANTYLARLFPGAGIRLPVGDGTGHEILIAGCGTGQQSIEVAQALRDARVLAIDLSLASLAYAQRQSVTLGVIGIEYAQADLLRLAEAGRRFDIVQASGVLHHMAEPLDGWRALLAVLRSGGVMQVGLYSELGRRDVVAARRWIAEQGFRPIPEDMRRCRQSMMGAPEGTPLRRLSTSSDFASMSGCRDLLFHVQEHRMTLPEVASFVTSHGLDFLGFDLPAPVTRAYRVGFPDDPTLTDIQHWDMFERANPDIFSGMYQFWVRKR